MAGASASIVERSASGELALRLNNRCLTFANGSFAFAACGKAESQNYRTQHNEKFLHGSPFFGTAHYRNGLESPLVQAGHSPQRLHTAPCNTHLLLCFD